MMSDVPVDQETVYGLMFRERWSELVDLIHRHREMVAEDPLLGRAVKVFSDHFFERLPAADLPAVKPALEKLFLLHVGGFHRLEERHFEQVVEHLVALHEDRPEAAAGYARHCPDNERCARMLERMAVRRRAEHDQSDRISLCVTRPADGANHTVSLFRSKQEIDFYMAVREVFATYFVYPNVAVSTLIDFDGIRHALAPAERSYFFQAVVDCVVFDQHDGYRPGHFFELDSSLHDVEERREKDDMKDRILSTAGARLHRIRVLDRRAGRGEFVRMLKEEVQDGMR